MIRSPRLFARALLDRLARTPKEAKEGPVCGDARLMTQANQQYVRGHRDIATSIDDPTVAQKLLDRVIAQWQQLGASDPFWSNDTRDEFKRDNLTEDKVRDFYAGGEGASYIIGAFESRSGVKIGSGVCVELGCGVGKHTHVLARRFSRVIAIDVSAGGLAICEQRMKAFGLDNVETRLLTSPDDLGKCGTIDLFFSLSVLQHNPPPIQRLMLGHALASLGPGGFSLFQTPDSIEGYVFSTEQFLAAPDAMFDLHCLPKTDVLSILAGHDMRLLDFAPDFTLGAFGSYTYFARKPYADGEAPVFNSP